MEKYYYLEVPSHSDFDQEISDLAHKKFNCSGIEEFSIDEPRVDEILGERSYSGADLPLDVINEVDSTVNVDNCFTKFFFNTQEQALVFKSFLLINYKLEADIVEKEQQDWNLEWKKSYEKIVVDVGLIIVPAWEKTPENALEHKNVFIYPGMGFGTGGHETTFLCLKSIQSYKGIMSESFECLDFGCGSGILGIALNKLYKIKADLYDIDECALENCIQNIELNNLNKDDFKLLLPKQRSFIEKKYNIVFANILQNVLLSEAKYLVNSLKPNGILILSGLLKGQEDEVINHYSKLKPDLKYIRTLTKNDWVSVEMVLQK